MPVTVMDWDKEVDKALELDIVSTVTEAGLCSYCTHTLAFHTCRMIQEGRTLRCCSKMDCGCMDFKPGVS